MRDGVLVAHFNRNFPVGFLPTTSGGLFRDLRPAPQICTSLFQIVVNTIGSRLRSDAIQGKEV